MKNKIFKIMAFMSFLLFPGMVLAADFKPTVTPIDSDLYYVETPNVNVVNYLVSKTTLEVAQSFEANNGTKYLSLPNGTFNIWAKAQDGKVSDPVTIEVTNSCNNEYLVNMEGSGTLEKCYVTTLNGKTEKPTGILADSCKAGYFMALDMKSSDCGTKTFVGTGLGQRYCKVVYNYTCSDVSRQYNANLDNLEIDGVALTPGFSSQVHSYTATTTQSEINIKATLQNTNSSFEEGYGPRKVQLKLGSNNVIIRTKTTWGGSAVYIINIKRISEKANGNVTSGVGKVTTNTTSSESLKDTNNYLKSLSVENADLSSEFKAENVEYTVNLAENVEKVKINATLDSSKAKFKDEFGPREVNLEKGTNRFYIKVVSEAGKIRTYTLIINRGESTKDTNDARLISLSIEPGNIAFEKSIFDYNATVGSDVTNITVNAVPFNEADTVTVTGGNNLEVGSNNEITITVTSAETGKVNVYSIYVTRKEEGINISQDSTLKTLEIKNHKINFKSNNKTYKITLKNNEKKLGISAEANDSKSLITIEGNENLKNGDQVKIRVVAEDDSYTDYILNIKEAGKGSVVLTIIIVILIILILIYIVLRAMGYRISINLDALKNRFKRK